MHICKMDATEVKQFKIRESEYTIYEKDSLAKFIAPATVLLVSLARNFTCMCAKYT
jgi:hypothetical protein